MTFETQTRKPGVRAPMIVVGVIMLLTSFVPFSIPVNGDLLKHVVFFLWFFLGALSFFSDAAKSVSLTIDPSSRRYKLNKTSLLGKNQLEGDLDQATKVVVRNYSLTQLGGGKRYYTTAFITNTTANWKFELSKESTKTIKSLATAKDTISIAVLELGHYWSKRLGLPLETNL